jgi:NTP pyrophosphatase (non-canonical NTP hydrolase)
MYTEEKIINGVLCYRNSPTASFIEYTLPQLTAKLAQYKTDNLYYTLQEEIVGWATIQFSSSNQQTVIRKLVMEEIPELVLALAKSEVQNRVCDELADVMILLMDYSHRANIDILAEVMRKMEVNYKRSWVIDEFGVSQHIEGPNNGI